MDGLDKADRYTMAVRGTAFDIEKPLKMIRQTVHRNGPLDRQP